MNDCAFLTLPSTVHQRIVLDVDLYEHALVVSVNIASESKCIDIISPIATAICLFLMNDRDLLIFMLNQFTDKYLNFVYTVVSAVCIKSHTCVYIYI